MNERGSAALWMLGLGMSLLLVGGISVDLWLLLGERRELAAVVDAAAIAASSAVDEVEWRAHGDLRLDAGEAERRSLAVIERHLGADGVVFPAGWLVVGPDARTVTITLERPADLTLLRLTGVGATTVRASARATIEVRG